MRRLLIVSLLLAATAVAAAETFPPEMVQFVPCDKNPIFEGSGPGHWDESIRERGWILHEDNLYHLWYTGYQNADEPKKLGYATSPDGITWTRCPQNPIHTQDWVEDMCVVKDGDTYYMFAEGAGDHAHWFTSKDRINWKRQGPLDIRLKDGSLPPDGPYGTPFVLHEDGKWYLFYEKNDDQAVWLAKTDDLKVWTNVQDEPILKPGPEKYDKDMIAVNQVIKHNRRYYAYYHGLDKSTRPRENWTTAVAASDDLLHWEKYSGNPLLTGNQSSAFVVKDGDKFRLYAMHPAVRLYLPKK
jgi:predicted GH43/DUF377 family glycosyl hydrolase